MKKLVILFGILFAFQLGLRAQLTDQEPIIFNAHLLETFNLNVVTGGVQEITFAVANDYNNGVTEVGGISPGFSTITMETTGDWILNILCPDFLPDLTSATPGTGTIPINNLGLWCEATGTHQFGTEVTCAYQSAAAAMGLQTTNQLLFGLGGTPNAGDATDNAFTLHWLMGTRQGTMNTTTTMFDQMSSGVFGPGDFTSTALLTLVQQ
jgi:hypothetical protein